MKELIKSNKKEEQYSEIEGYCEHDGDNYRSYCPSVTCQSRGDCPSVTCTKESYSQDEMVDILF